MHDDTEPIKRRRVSRRTFIAGTAAALAGGVAACDNGGEGPDGSTVDPTGPVGGTRPQGTSIPSSSTPPADVVRGGTLRVGVVGSVADIYDGQFASSKADQVRVALAFEPLVHYDRNGELSYEHGVAEAVDVLAADRYRITLKTEARFSNGESVTANDVVYSIRRRADPESLAHHPALSAILDGAVVEAADDTSVDVTLAAGNITFLDELAESSMTVVPAGYDRYTGDPTAQIGSGPFVLAQFEPGVRSVHRRNEDYWWDPDLPYLDEVHVIDYPDQTALLNALTGHEVDAIIDVPYDRAAEVAALEGLTLLDAPTGQWVTITMAGVVGACA